METNNIKHIVKNLGGIISKNSPTILTGLAVGGLVTTVILAVKATPTVFSLIDDEVYSRYEESNTDETFAEWLGVSKSYTWEDRKNILTKKEIVKLTWRYYIPAAAVGTATIICIVGANSINLRRNAAIGAVYSLTEAAFKEYKDKVTETLGKGKEQKVRDEIAKDRITNNPPNNSEIIFTGKGDVLCYDSISGRYFKSDIEKIRKAKNDLNEELLHDMFVSLNDAYYALGLPNTSLGDEMGWNIDKGQIEFSFSSQLTENGEPCLVLDYVIEPKFKYGD